MRTVHIIVICLGLTLLVISSFEIRRVRQYRSVVSQVQTTASSLYQGSMDTLRRAHFSYTIVPSMESVLSELDAADRLERGWWEVCGIGSAVSVAGLVGIVCRERLRRTQGANTSLQATAAAPDS